jgi:hypothetical protein
MGLGRKKQKQGNLNGFATRFYSEAGTRMTLSAQYMDQPFDGAIGFFRQKLNLPTERWDDLWQGMHSRAFVIAGGTKGAFLEDMRGALDKAIAKGTTIAEFRGDFDTIVGKHGWKYKGGRGWRTAVIYNTNLSTAYAAGHWQRMTAPDMLKARPYLRYIESSSATPRAEHLAWAGTVLPADDPWWQTHYPPNGWGCKCGATSHSAREVERLKKEGVVKRTEAPPVSTYQYPQKSTGEILDVPEGIDPGWDYNVGQAAWGKRLSDKAMNEYRAAGKDAWEKLTPGNWETYGRPEIVPVDVAVAAVGRKITDRSVAALEMKKIIGGDEQVYQVPGGGSWLVNAESLIEHIEPDLEARSPFLPFLPETLTSPYEVWISFEQHKGTGKVVLRQRLIKVIRDGRGKDRGMIVVANARNGVMETWSVMQRSQLGSLKNIREGKLLWSRE